MNAENADETVLAHLPAAQPRHPVPRVQNAVASDIALIGVHRRSSAAKLSLPRTARAWRTRRPGHLNWCGPVFNVASSPEMDAT
jgi:hypothetical protein